MSRMKRGQRRCGPLESECKGFIRVIVGSMQLQNDRPGFCTRYSSASLPVYPHSSAAQPLAQPGSWSSSKGLQTLEDKDQLAELLNTYYWTADHHDWEGYANTWLDDVNLTIDDWGVVRGKEDIVKSASSVNAYEGVQHIIANMKSEVDGSDQATGSASLWFCVTPEIKTPAVNYTLGGRYAHEVVRTNQG
jgi:hypothetical protein